MDHRAFLASLSPDTRAALTRRSTFRGLVHLTGHMALLSVASIGIAQGGWITAVSLPAQGILICFLFTLLHETTHRTPFANDRLNDTVGYITGGVLFIGFNWFRHFHFAHHRHTNDPERDPELATAKPETRLGLWWHLSGLPLWWSSGTTVLANAVRVPTDTYLPVSIRKTVRKEARILLLLYLGVALSLFFSNAAFWYWLLPLVLGQPALRIYLLAEHDRCPEVTDMFQNTRTTFTTGLLRFIAWNMPYHAEHHTLPAAPFHQLPNLNKHMAQHLQVVSEGYASFATERISTTPLKQHTAP